MTIGDGDFKVFSDGGLLKQMQQEVHAWCVRKGWEPDHDRQFGTECALITSEVSEALEAYREHGFERWVTDEEGKRWLVGQSDPDNGDPKGLATYPSSMKPEGVASEFADVLVRLLHYAEVHGIDLFAEFRAKMDYNNERSYRHGNRAC